MGSKVTSAQNMAYAIARCYVQDSENVVQDVGLLKRALGLIRARDLEGICSLPDSFDPVKHGQVEMAFLRQCSAFFKKNADFADDDRCMGAAVSGFHKAEAVCALTNGRFLALSCGHGDHHTHGVDPDSMHLLERAKSYIRRTLGPIGPFLDSFHRGVRITSGATVDRSRSDALPYLKLDRHASCTTMAAPVLERIVRLYGYKAPVARLVDYNRVTVVPKNWKTHRTIACEPTANVAFQLAFDRYAKLRLRRRGIDLSDQEVNQRLARAGSIDGSYATIDLSAASDTIAREVVRFLFPQEWFTFLSVVRTPKYKSTEFSGGEEVPYQKFSSMGNGSTFTIETLIFAAVCHAVGSRDFNVYGDDIVVDTEHADLVTHLLGVLGFSVNLEKSFFAGPFRESCGKDYYLGNNICPFYLRSWTKMKTNMAHVVNGIVSLGASLGGRSLWKLAARIIKENELIFVPRNDDSTTGVHIEPFDAYERKLIQVRHCIPRFRAYIVSSKTRLNVDSRSLFVWHHAAEKRDADADDWVKHALPPNVQRHSHGTTLRGDLEVTSVPSLSHRFRKGWRNFVPTTTSADSMMLFEWAEWLRTSTSLLS